MELLTDEIEPRERHRPFLWFWLVLIASIVLSGGGFVYGAYHDPASDGGRGGALATALAFASLFVRSNFSSDVRRTVAEVLPVFRNTMQDLLKQLGDQTSNAVVRSPEVQELSDKIEGLTAMLAAKDREQLIQNGFIASASVIGTISWGFGDIVANHLKSWFF